MDRVAFPVAFPDFKLPYIPYILRYSILQYIYLNCKFVKFVKTCQGVGPGPGAEVMESCNRKLLHVCLGLGVYLILQKMNENELSNLVTKLYVQV